MEFPPLPNKKMHENSLGVLFPGSCFRLLEGITPQKTNMIMGNPPLEDAFPIEIGNFPMSC